MSGKLFLTIVFLSLAFPFSTFADSESQSEHHHGTELAAEPFSPDSLFQLESMWTTSNGETVRFSDFRGKPRILTMFYSSCTAACPVLVENVRRIERAIKKAGMSMPGFVLVTFDPARDTVNALEQFKRKRALSDEEWLLLRGGEEDTLELAVLLGMKYKQSPDGNFSHSNIITLLDAEGRIIERHIGLRLEDSEIDTFLRALRK